MIGKIEITGKIKVLTGLHIGGSESFSAIGAIDSPVVRDAFSGEPMIPGSSLKGKIRTLLAQIHNDKEKNPTNAIEDDAPEIKRLFGYSAADKAQGIVLFSVPLALFFVKKAPVIQARHGVMEAEVLRRLPALLPLGNVGDDTLNIFRDAPDLPVGEGNGGRLLGLAIGDSPNAVAQHHHRAGVAEAHHLADDHAHQQTNSQHDEQPGDQPALQGLDDIRLVQGGHGVHTGAVDALEIAEHRAAIQVVLHLLHVPQLDLLPGLLPQEVDHGLGHAAGLVVDQHAAFLVHQEAALGGIDMPPAQGGHQAIVGTVDGHHAHGLAVFIHQLLALAEHPLLCHCVLVDDTDHVVAFHGGLVPIPGGGRHSLGQLIAVNQHGPILVGGIDVGAILIILGNGVIQGQGFLFIAPDHILVPGQGFQQDAVFLGHLADVDCNSFAVLLHGMVGVFLLVGKQNLEEKSAEHYRDQDQRQKVKQEHFLLNGNGDPGRTFHGFTSLLMTRQTHCSVPFILPYISYHFNIFLSNI